MKISFDFEMDDWMAFQAHYLKTNTYFKVVSWMMTLILPVALFSSIIFQEMKELTRTVMIGFVLVMSGLWVVFLPRFMMNQVMKRTRKMIENGDNSGFIGPQEVEFSEEGIIHTAPASQTTYQWKGIVKFQENEDYFFLYVTAVSAIIIPKKKIGGKVEEVKKPLGNLNS